MAQRVRKFIRYMAATDATPIGDVALEYLRGLLRIAPVRVVSVTGGAPEGRWEHYAQLLTTPIGPTYINVVCCAPVRWSWMLTDQIPVVKDGKTVGTERVQKRIDFYTVGVRNVLIMPAAPEGPHQAAAAAKFEARVVPRSEILEAPNFPTGCLATMIDIPLHPTGHDRLRTVIDP